MRNGKRLLSFILAMAVAMSTFVGFGTIANAVEVNVLKTYDFIALSNNAADKTGFTNEGATVKVAGTDCTVGTGDYEGLAFQGNWFLRPAQGLYQGNGGARKVGILDLKAGQQVVVKANSAVLSLADASNAEQTSLDSTTYTYTMTADGMLALSMTRYFFLESIVVQELVVDEDAVATDYTIKYVDGEGNSIKEDKVASSYVGEKATATAGDMESVYTNGKKYVYASGNAEITLVENAASNVITLTFAEAATKTFAVSAKSDTVDLGVIKADVTGFVGDTANVPYPKYILKDDVLYTKDATNKEYKYPVVISENQTDVVIDYTATDKTDIVYYSEAEDIHGLTADNGGQGDSRSSNAYGAYAKADTTIAILSAGTYTLTTAICGNKDTTFTFAAGDATILETITDGSWGEKVSTSFELTEETAIVLKAAGQAGASSRLVDYVLITGTGEVVDTYNVNVETAENGTVTANKNIAKEGDTVTITATPADEDCSLESIAVTAEDGSAVTVAEDNTFVMPAQAVTITAVFKRTVKYDVTVNSEITNGTATTDVAKAEAGATVTITATPAEGYKVASYEVKSADDTAVDVTADGTFTMPEQAVTVSVIFEVIPKYDVTVDTATVNGSVAVDVEKAEEGATVTVTATPAEGYEARAIKVTAADGTAVKVTDGKFTMPAQAVTVTATFKEPVSDEAMSVSAALVHTAAAQGGSNAAGTTLDTESHYYNNWGTSGWAATAYSEFSFEDTDVWSGTATRIKSATLTFQANCGGSKDGRSIDVALLDATTTAGINFETAVNMIGKPANATTISGVNRTYATYTLDVTDALKARIKDGDTRFIFAYAGGAAGGQIYGKGSATGAPTLTVELFDGSVVPTIYTINYVDADGNVLKEARTDDCNAGDTVSAIDTDLVAIVVDGEKYVYASGNDAITAVADASSNVIKLVFNKLDKYNVTVKAVDSATEAELGEVYTGIGYAGEDAKYSYPAYYLVKTDANPTGAYYKAEATTYSGTVSAISADVVETVKYTLDDSVVAFMEGENAPKTNNNVAINAYESDAFSSGKGSSIQQSAIEALSFTFTAPVAGTYTLSAPLYNANDKTRGYDVYVDDFNADTRTTLGYGEVATNASGSFSYDVELTAGEHTVYYALNYSLTPAIDYLLVDLKEASVVVPTTYDVTVATATNGTVAVDKATAAEGDTVTITATAADGYEVDTITVTDADNAAVTVTNNTFVMPAKAVTVTVTFKETSTVVEPTTYDVTVAEATNGTVTVDKAAAAEGDTVTITATPADGYKLDTITVTDADNAAVTVTDNTFVMPAKAVTVTVTFKAKPADIEEKTLYTMDVKALGDVTVSKLAADGGTDADVATIHVEDFGTGTDVTPAVAALDGWGYMHWGYTAALTAGRQTNAHVTASENALYAQGVGNSGANGAISFIPANVDGMTLPTSGVLVYTFDSSVVSTGGGHTADLTVGFTSGTGSAVANAGSVALPTGATYKMTLVNDLNEGEYYIYVDGVLKKSGTAANITGVFAQVAAKYVKVGIANLVLEQKNTAPNAVKVTFVGDADAVLAEYGSVIEGTALTAPTAPSVTGKTFVEWQNAAGEAVTEFAAGATDTVYTAVYREGSTVSTVNVTTSPFAKVSVLRAGDGEVAIDIYTDANGVGAFADITQGEYTYTITKKGYAEKTGSFTLGMENYALSETLEFDADHSGHVYYEADWANGSGAWTAASNERNNETSFKAVTLPELSTITATLNFGGFGNNAGQQRSWGIMTDGGALVGLQFSDNGIYAWTGWTGNSAWNQSGDIGAYTTGKRLGDLATGELTFDFVVDTTSKTITVSYGDVTESLAYTIDATAMTGLKTGLYRYYGELKTNVLEVTLPDPNYLAINGVSGVAKVSGAVVERTYSLSQTVVNADETFTWTVTDEAGNAIEGVTIENGVLKVADTATPGVAVITCTGSSSAEKTATLKVTIGDFQKMETFTVDGPQSYNVTEKSGVYTVVSAIDSFGDEVKDIVPAVVWTSSDESVITVDAATGAATVVGAGSATITATLTNGTAVSTATIPVTVATYYVVAEATGDSTVVDITSLVDNAAITGYQVTTIKDGAIVNQTVVAKADVTGGTKTTTAKAAGEKIVATYDANGAITNITATAVAEGDVVDLTAAENTKVFLWNSLNGMAPVAVETVVENATITVDTTGATTVEVAPVYQTTVGALLAIPAATYNITVTANSGARTDVYANEQMLINNLNQSSDGWTVGRVLASSTDYEVEDIVIDEGYVKFKMYDDKSNGTTVTKVVLAKTPDNVTRAKRIYTIGDSLVANYYGEAPEGKEGLVRTGWGQVFDLFVKDEVGVTNLGNSGAEAVGMLGAAFTNVKESAKKGDIVIWESGYNDRSYSTVERMKAAITEAIDYCNENGIEFYLVNPNASSHDYTGSVVWAQDIRNLADETDTPLIDLSQKSYDFLNGMYAEVEDVKTLLNTYYNNTGDTLHSSYNAANCWAAIVAQGLYDAGHSDCIDTTYSYTFNDGIQDVTVKVVAAE